VQEPSACRLPRGNRTAAVSDVHIAQPGRRGGGTLHVAYATGLRPAVLEELVDAHASHIVAGALGPAEQLSVEAQCRCDIRRRQLVPRERALCGGTPGGRSASRGEHGKRRTLRIRQHREAAHIRNICGRLDDTCAETLRLGAG